jgi:hypothetical protein
VMFLYLWVVFGTFILERSIALGSYLLRNVKVKAQIEKPLRKEIIQ